MLYHGGRRRQDLYDLADLRQIEVAYPWLRNIFAVSDEAVPDDIGGDVMYGTVPELAATANWFDRDVYISGPDAMIRRTARVLDDLGDPPPGPLRPRLVPRPQVLAEEGEDPAPGILRGLRLEVQPCQRGQRGQ